MALSTQVTLHRTIHAESRKAAPKKHQLNHKHPSVFALCVLNIRNNKKKNLSVVGCQKPTMGLLRKAIWGAFWNDNENKAMDQNGQNQTGSSFLGMTTPSLSVRRGIRQRFWPAPVRMIFSRRGYW